MPTATSAAEDPKSAGEKREQKKDEKLEQSESEKGEVECKAEKNKEAT